MQIHPHDFQYENEVFAISTRMFKVIQEIHDIFGTFQFSILFSIFDAFQCLELAISMTFHIEFQSNCLSISAINTYATITCHLKSSDSQQVEYVPLPNLRMTL